jgi:hypothetical protein
VATLVLIGPAVREGAAELLAWCHRQAAPKNAEMIFSANAIPAADAAIPTAILRVAATSTQLVAEFLHGRCGFVAALLGDDPWARKH